MLKPTIGIEVHCELKTNSKAFSPSMNTYGEVPNKKANVIDLGYPGTLPTLNKGLIDLGIKCALVLHCEVTKEMFFDRKNYFYPDNPKNYQITQNNTPIGRNGYVEIEYNGIKKKIEIEEIHVEEDTCKSIHEGNHTLLNFNRAGIPLIEIVTKPCISNETEAVLYLENLREMLLYAGVSDVKIEEGSMRCEPNISLSDSDKLGTKVEVKNIGSISAVRESILYEIERQTELLNEGKVLKEETRRWDDKTKTTILMRVKETGNDYRYFPEPDIPKVVLSDEWIESIRKTIPMLPNELKSKYKELGINDVTIKSLIQNQDLSIALNELIDSNINPILSANILTSEILSYMNSHYLKFNELNITLDNIKDIVNMLSVNKISSKIAKEIISELLENGGNVGDIINKKGLSQISDVKVLKDIINNILNNNPKAIEDYNNGLDRSIKFLMGQIMKETKGQANPKLANDMLIEELKNRS
ncbi:MAG: Asp-tRNA(Asn)/Glu-tRNA(Gln) amidotransferase subunit GatB [Bacilli bacterium]|nr:Asp-tRNA(Asn)/Glu-tRNA(Gln) amidotransferase subunit GatB [Bacilli bacterium]MBQ6282501.1 Asp-tRNA(Asn)/Glu-tRNA(Gln) amidotransferase subunit GatB [Bacilli bacterium]